jgi:hypothetical protein
MTEEKQQIRDEFLKSRDGAIMRCASIMIESGRGDLAKQILLTTKIDKDRFTEIRRLNA